MPRSTKIGRPKLPSNQKKYPITLRLQDQIRIKIEKKYGTIQNFFNEKIKQEFGS